MSDAVLLDCPFAAICRMATNMMKYLWESSAFTAIPPTHIPDIVGQHNERSHYFWSSPHTLQEKEKAAKGSSLCNSMTNEDKASTSDSCHQIPSCTGPPRHWNAWSTPPMRELGLPSLEKRRFREDIIMPINTWKEGELFSAVPRARKSGKEHPVLGVPVESGVVPDGPRGPFHLHPLWDSVIMQKSILEWEDLLGNSEFGFVCICSFPLFPPPLNPSSYNSLPNTSLVLHCYSNCKKYQNTIRGLPPFLMT